MTDPTVQTVGNRTIVRSDEWVAVRADVAIDAAIVLGLVRTNNLIPDADPAWLKQLEDELAKADPR